jgi:hypothetical protein
MFENLKHFDMFTKIEVQRMSVKNNMVGFFFSKIIAKLKDSRASEGPHHLSMRPFYFKKKV